MPEPTPDEPMRRAIVLVPGIQRVERFVRRDRLVDNLATVERHPLAAGGEVVADGAVDPVVLGQFPLAQRPGGAGGAYELGFSG